MIQTTPEKIRSLRRKLYVKAKAEPDFRIGSGIREGMRVVALNELTLGDRRVL